MFKAELQKKCT